MSAGMDLVRAGAPVVNDMRFVNFHVATAEVIAVRNVPFIHPETAAKRRIAFVAACTLSFGMLRVLATMRDYDGQTTGVFRDFGEAFRWIDRPIVGEALPREIDLLLDDALRDGDDEDAFQVTVKHA
jgi:hypothetical protein